MTALLALSPILVIVALMVGARWSAARAGIVGLLVTLVVALVVFGYGDRVEADIGAPWAVAGALVEAVFTAATILWIVFPALCIHELQTRTGAIDVLRRSLERLSADPRILAILIAWFFALFLEGAAGFGTPVALTAPILVSLGFGPVQAVTMALIGHAAGVSFGAVGTPVLAQMAATGLDGLALAGSTGILHGLLGWTLLLFLLRAARREENRTPAQDDRRAVWGWVALAAALFLVPHVLLSRWVGPELPTLGGALLGGLGFVAALRRYGERRSAARSRSGGEGVPALVRAALPYLTLLALILITRLIPPLREALMAIEWQWTLFDGFTGAFGPLYHPGTMLLLGFLLGGLGQGHRGAELLGAMARAARRVAPVVVALVAMLGLARLMVHAGMIETLAVAAAGTLGGVWPLVAPLVGVLGTFVTGSATASNILFTDFQRATATRLDLPVLTLLGAQGFGAAVGNIIAPHNIIAGSATVGIAGKEGEVLRSTILACAVYAGLGGIVLYLMLAA